VLQRFIEPKTTRNEVIRAIWSPKVCLLERAENVHQLHDHRYGLYERCVIYEGPEYYFTSAPLRGPVLSGQIQKLCESIVAHISEVTFGQKAVSRIVLNFKVDSRDKIWLLYSTSTRCIDMLEYNSLTNADATRLKRTLVNIDSVISLSNTVHLNPQKSYKNIVPKKRIRCLSCAKESLEDMRHPITYKSVIKHYDHVMHLLTESTTGKKKDVIQWPPDAEVVEAAGGVNFGCLYMNDSGEMLNQREVEHLMKPKNVRDLSIPPILQSIHSKLTVKSYLQCKNDPLFLYKTVHVCEPCYLVFAEFTTLLLKMGGDLTKLLTPDPVAQAHLFDISSHSQSGTLATRASDAEWRAIGSVNQERSADNLSSSYKNANYKQAKASAIGLRTSDSHHHQPSMPRTIDKPQKNRSVGHYESGRLDGEPSQYTNNSTIATHELDDDSIANSFRFGVSAPNSGVYDHTGDDVATMIADRERHFFKEVSMNPQLKDQHPLMHLISTQQKLKLVDEQSGVLKSNKTAEAESVFGSKYGKPAGDKFDVLSVYSKELPYSIRGEVILPSKLRLRKAQETEQRRREKKLRKKSFEMRSDPQSTEDDDADFGSAVGAEESVKSDSTSLKEMEKMLALEHASKDENVQASAAHRDYLKNSLQALDQELESEG
jgi:hypothetical protein